MGEREPLAVRLRAEADEWDSTEPIPALLIEAADAIEHAAADIATRTHQLGVEAVERMTAEARVRQLEDEREVLLNALEQCAILLETHPDPRAKVLLAVVRSALKEAGDEVDA